MKVFLSYTHHDSFLAKKITSGFEEIGLDVWNAEMEILPGDNWAEQTSNALKESDTMVVLITPESLESRIVSREIQYALGNKTYSNRLIPVLVGSEEHLPSKSIPWILRKLKTIRLSNPDDDKGICRIIEAISNLKRTPPESHRIVPKELSAGETRSVNKEYGNEAQPSLLKDDSLDRSGKHHKMELLYDYLNSAGFKQRVETMVEAFGSMKKQIGSERASTGRIWAKREKEIDRYIGAVSGIYGDMRDLLETIGLDFGMDFDEYGNPILGSGDAESAGLQTPYRPRRQKKDVNQIEKPENAP